MTKSTITREQAEDTIEGLQELISRGVQSVYLDIAIAGLRQLVSAMDQKPALHRYRRKSVEPYGPYPWHYEVFVDYPRPVECLEDEYFYAAPPVVTGFAVDGEPAENHIGSKNALDAIVSFIKSKGNPTVKCYEEVSEQLFKDNCHGIHSHVIEYILKLGEELEDLRAEQDEIQSAPVDTTEAISFDEWSRKCALQITLCYPDFREKAKYIWDSARETQHVAPVVPDDVLKALQKVARIRLDLNEFDGDRRGIADCLCDAEEALIEVVNRRADMLNGGKP